MSDFIWGIDIKNFDTLQQPAMETTFSRMTNKWLDHTSQAHLYGYMTLIAPMLRKLWSYRFFLQETDNFFTKLTRDAVAMRREQKNELAQRPDFLNHLLLQTEKRGLTYDDLVGYSLLVYLDGYETTGYALLHTMYYVSLNKLRRIIGRERP